MGKDQAKFTFKIAGEIAIEIAGYGPSVRRASLAIIREFAPELAIEAERLRETGEPIRIAIERDAGRLTCELGEDGQEPPYEWEGK